MALSQGDDRRDDRRVRRRQMFQEAWRGTACAFTVFWAAGLLNRPFPTEAAKKKPAPPPPGSPPDKQDTTGITVQPTDPAIVAGMIEYPGVITPLSGYLATPKNAETYPGVLILHDIYGLTEHFKDVARRLARVGYVALAPDLLSRDGGTASLGDPANSAQALQNLGFGQILQDLNASVRHLESLPLVSKTQIGAMGFGFGGAAVWLLVAQNPDVKAAVSISGNFPSTRVVPGINAAVLAIVGESEQQSDDEVQTFDAAMKRTGLPWLYKKEPKAGPQFFNDTTANYVPAAAKDAWQMTLDWFTKHLTG